MKFIAIVVLLAGAANAAAPHKKESPADTNKKAETAAPASVSTIKLVKYFINTPTEHLDPDRIPEFMEVKSESLPKGLRGKYLAKKEELLVLKKLADSRKKPPVRRAGIDEAPPANQCLPDPPVYLSILPTVGYGTVTEDEEKYIEDKTKCTECEMITEFTLRKVEKPNAIGKKAFVYFLHGNDPLWNLVATYRAGIKNPFGTNFFGIGTPTCH